MPRTLGRVAATRALWEAVRGARRPGAPSVAARLAAVPRMVVQGLTGRYPHLDRSRMAGSALALLYVLSPVDLVPELLLPLVGLGDDAVVLAFLVGSLLSETDAFLEWERERGRTVVGQVL